MHTFDGKRGTIFNFNSDMSGTVEIEPKGRPPVSVPATDMLEFVAAVVRAQRIAQLESASTAELLGIPGAPQ